MFPYLTHDKGLHYLTFMGRNLDNKKKLAPVWIVNSTNTNTMNNASIFSEYSKMNLASCE